jgi:hypothetical protein
LKNATPQRKKPGFFFDLFFLYFLRRGGKTKKISRKIAPDSGFLDIFPVSA